MIDLSGRTGVDDLVWWVADSRDSWRRLQSMRSMITGAEERRAARLHHDQDRIDYLAAHLLARCAAAALTDAQVEDCQPQQECGVCGGVDHGRPTMLIGGRCRLSVSWSHRAGRVAVAAARRPVGVDVEVHDQQLGAELIMTDAERAQARADHEPGAAVLEYWTRKEALVKAGAGDLDQAAGWDLTRGAGFGRWASQAIRLPELGVVTALALGAPGGPGRHSR